MEDVIIEDIDDPNYLKSEKTINEKDNKKKNMNIKKQKNKKKKPKLKKLNIFLLMISFIWIILTFFNTFLIFKYDVLPFKYLIIFLLFVVILPIFLMFLIGLKKVKNGFKILISVIGIIYIIILSFSFFYLNKTFTFLDDFTTGYTYEIKNYALLVLKSSESNSVSSLEDKKIGFVKDINDEISKSLTRLEAEITFTKEEYKDYENILIALDNLEVDAILLGDAYISMLSEEDEKFNFKYKIIYEFSLKEKVEEIKKEVDVTKDTFNVYISGIDSYGSVSSLTRSDVNIVASINPKTNEILLVNIPRDYYVSFPGTDMKDKLTHAGIYGIDMSVKAIEELLDIEINYYFKVNYSALVNLVNALGGVDVYSKYSFTSVGTDKDYYYQKGYNYVTGEKALYFVRTRKAFLDGDRVRGENQQAMIQAIIKKASSPSILTKYSDILNSLNGSFATNIGTDNITNLVKMQLNDMKGWEITSIGLSGTDSYNYTYTYPYQQLYVMEPNQDTILSAKESLRKLVK